MENSVAAKRNYGIDLMKVLSMIMIVILHVLKQGGILDLVTADMPQFYVAWFLELSAYCAVNCFAMATGYLMVGHRFRYRKIVGLWLTVQYYNVIFFLFERFILEREISKAAILTFFPIFSGEYWYFTAYFCMFLFIPFINTMIEHLSKKSLYRLLLTGFLIFSLALIVFQHDSFKLSGGYSAVWLTYLYFVGAAIKKYGLFLKISAPKALLGYFGSVGISFAAKCLDGNAELNDWGLLGTHIEIYTPQFVNYLAPTIFAAGIFLMLFCLKLKIPKFFGELLGVLQPLVFQVYIIHLHRVIWNGLMYKRFESYVEASPLRMGVYVVATALLIFEACILMDFVRNALFKRCKVNKLIDKAADKLVAWNEKKQTAQENVKYIEQ